MKYDFAKRACEFGVFNNRLENMGPDQKRKAIDLPMKWQIKPKELDMLVPAQGTLLSQFLFGDDLRKPVLQCPLLSPLKVQRKPEHITLTIYDDGVDKRKKLTFTDVSIKDPILEFDDETIFLKCKAQLHPDGMLQRINDNVEGKTLQFECKATQPELFDQDSEDEGEGEDDGQADIEDEEEDEEEDED